MRGRTGPLGNLKRGANLSARSENCQEIGASVRGCRDPLRAPKQALRPGRRAACSSPRIRARIARVVGGGSGGTMRILDRYVLRRHVGPFLFAAATITFLFVMRVLVDFLGLFASRSLDLGTIAETFVL